MIVQEIYCGGKQISHIYLAGKIIWPAWGELSVEHALNLFSDGYYVLLASDAVILCSDAMVATVGQRNLSFADIQSLLVENVGRTTLDGHPAMCPIVSIQVEASSLSAYELSTFLAKASYVSFAWDSITSNEQSVKIAWAAYGDYVRNHLSYNAISTLIADALYPKPAHEDIASSGDVGAVIRAAVCVPPIYEDMTTRDEANAEMLGAVYIPSVYEDLTASGESQAEVKKAAYTGAEEESSSEYDVSADSADIEYLQVEQDSLSDDEVAVENTPAAYVAAEEDSLSAHDAKAKIVDPLPLAAKEDSSSDDESHLITPELILLGTDAGSAMQEELSPSIAGAVSIHSMLRFATTIEANMMVASSAGVSSQEENETKEEIFLHFDAEEEPEYIWYDPIQEGTNVYIRSAYYQRKEGSNVRLDNGG